jgi:hypothetical protein
MRLVRQFFLSLSQYINEAKAKRLRTHLDWRKSDEKGK